MFHFVWRCWNEFNFHNDIQKYIESAINFCYFEKNNKFNERKNLMKHISFWVDSAKQKNTRVWGMKKNIFKFKITNYLLLCGKNTFIVISITLRYSFLYFIFSLLNFKYIININIEIVKTEKFICFCWNSKKKNIMQRIYISNNHLYSHSETLKQKV